MEKGTIQANENSVSTSNNQLMSKDYRLMIYFAVTTMFIYSKSALVNGDNVKSFYDANPKLIARVCEEAKNTFGYELSTAQINRACYVYLNCRLSPQSVDDTEAYKISNIPV